MGLAIRWNVGFSTAVTRSDVDQAYLVLRRAYEGNEQRVEELCRASTSLTT